MLGIRFKKAPPTTYVIHYSNGVPVRQGAGLSFFYFAPTATIIDIPLASADVPFIFHEVTADFQEITIQGQLTYKVADPSRLAQMLDFSVDARGAHVVDDPEKLSQRLVETTQVLARGVTQRLPLPEALAGAEVIVAEVLPALKAAATVLAMGVEILALAVARIRPTPEIARALEAEARESLQRRSDQAIYARRNAAVGEERMIKESELNTEIAVAAKRRQIEEDRLAAEIALEERRSELIDRKVENERKDADSRAYALTTSLAPFKEADWRTLLALSGGGDPRQSIALAFQDLAHNAGKIGQLTITPELLTSLAAPPRK